jgi:hypothetical protein
MRTICLVLGALAVVSPNASTAQAGDKPYTIAGVVRDASSAPLSSAELSLSLPGSPLRLVKTGDDGRFSFTNVSPGSATLRVRRLGYKVSARNIDVGPNMSSQPFDFALEEVASDIEAVIVEGSKGHLDEFYNHKENNNFAKFFEQKEIEKRHPLFLSELLRSVAGANLAPSSRSGNRVLLRNCKPMVWVDGMRAPGAELDEVARPTDVAGLEIYPSSAGLPPQYQDRNNRMCGAIMVWTRNQ